MSNKEYISIITQINTDKKGELIFFKTEFRESSRLSEWIKYVKVALVYQKYVYFQLMIFFQKISEFRYIFYSQSYF